MTNTTNSLIDEKDFDNYERDLQSFLDGDLDPHRFIGIRLNLGIYAQKQDGMCMVRAKVPGGRLNPRQLLGFAEAAETYSGTNSVHITTRQDIQFHYIPLEKTPRLQRHLAAYDIATREAGGNTVRNITGCPLSGGCPAEHVDINAYIQQVARHFVRHPLTASLPRKFKISFSGCESDCSNGLVHDLGVIATRQDGAPGFRLLVGGGLGAKPKTAIVLNPFIPEDELLPAIEAVLAVHDRHSDRKRKMRSRIKFLIEKFGEAGFRERFETEFRRTLGAFQGNHRSLGIWRTAEAPPTSDQLNLRRPVPQHQPSLWVLPITVPGGELLVGQLRNLAEIMITGGLDDIRTTQDQNLSLFNIPEDKLEHIRTELSTIGLDTPRRGDRVVSCPGTATCPLGITASRHISPRLSGGVGDLSVRINGCQNGCANATISDIGLYGKGRRHHGKLVPSYTLQLGGNGSQNGQLAVSGPDIPAARVPSAVTLIHDSYFENRRHNESFGSWAQREGAEYFHRLLQKLSKVGPMELAFLTRDHGDSSVFRVESQGVGECAGAQAEPADKLLLDAKYESELAAAFGIKHKHSDAAECLANQLHLSSRALLEAMGLKSDFEHKEELIAALASALGSGSNQLQPLEKSLELAAAYGDSQDELQFAPLHTAAQQWSSWVEEQVERLRIQDLQQRRRSGTEG
jgi:sulfite reductase (ferredoxin)